METKIVAVKGPAGLYGRILAADLGQGLFGWYPVKFDCASPDDDCKFELTKPDDKFQLLHQKTDALFGADATGFSSDLTKQFYGKPGGPAARGAYESPVIYDGNLNGTLQGVVEYDSEVGKYFSCAFAVEVLS
jgi:hypothetical protein